MNSHWRLILLHRSSSRWLLAINCFIKCNVFWKNITILTYLWWFLQSWKIEINIFWSGPPCHSGVDEKVYFDSVQGLRLSRALRLWGWSAAGLGPGEGEGEGEAPPVMWGGGEGGESLSRPDICIDKKYLAAACLSCSRSSAVCRLK